MSPGVTFVTCAAILAVAYIVRWSLAFAKETLTPPSVPEMPDMLPEPIDNYPGPELDPETQERVNRYAEYMETAAKLDRKANQDALNGNFEIERMTRHSADQLRERARKALGE